MSNYIVGLTGGIGSGKSTVANHFAALGITLVDTDLIAHELTAARGAAMPALIAAFGEDITDANGALERAAMRRLVFSDPSAKKTLENILHPAIRQIASERCQTASSPYVLLVVPLLFESGSYREHCQRILVVDCSENSQMERVEKRSKLPPAEIRTILATQASRQQRLAIADDIVNNEGKSSELALIVSQLHIKYLSLSAKKAQANC